MEEDKFEAKPQIMSKHVTHIDKDIYWDIFDSYFDMAVGDVGIAETEDGMAGNAEYTDAFGNKGNMKEFADVRLPSNQENLRSHFFLIACCYRRRRR